MISFPPVDLNLASSTEIPQAVSASSQERLVPALTAATCRQLAVPVQYSWYIQDNRRRAPQTVCAILEAGRFPHIPPPPPRPLHRSHHRPFSRSRSFPS